MKLRQLVLERYGHLSDIRLAFPREAGFVVVHGPNEAGKSTALAALGDCLFGFGHRTRFDFLYPSSRLRIGAELVSRDGRSLLFFRRKGLKQTLLSAADEPLPEHALAPFLGAADRALFERAFGLNAEQLRAGATEILRGGGAAGESLFQASSGLAGLSIAMQRLDAEAAALHGSRRGQRALESAVTQWRDAKRELDERSVKPKEYEEKRQQREHIRSVLLQGKQQAESLIAERRRLERIRRTAPALRERARAQQQRSALGGIPSFPPDADIKRRDAVVEREAATRALTRFSEELEQLQTQLASLTPDPALLTEADAVERLADDRARIEAAERDRITQSAAAAESKQAITEASRALGVSVIPEAIGTRLPTALARAAIRRLITARAAIDERLNRARESLAAASARRAKLEAELAARPEAEHPALLRRTIDAIRAEGRLDQEIIASANEAIAARAALDRAMTSLRLWSDSAENLAAGKFPPNAAIESHRAWLEQAEAGVREAKQACASCDTEIALATARLAAIEAGGVPPSVAAIVEARQQRDAAWARLRAHLDGSAALTATELQALPASYEHFVVTADRLADERSAEARRAEALEQASERVALLRTRAAQATAERARAEAALSDCQEAWRALWYPCGIDPESPASMLEWTVRRDEMLRLLRAAEEVDCRSRTLISRRTDAIRTLTSLLQTGPQHCESLAALLAYADHVCEQRDQAVRERSDLARALALLAEDLRQLEQREQAASRDLAVWQNDWSAATQAAGIDPNCRAEDAEAALLQWERIENAANRWHAATQRVNAMTEAIERFASEAARLSAQLAPELTSEPPIAIARALSARLAQAQSIRGQRSAIEQRITAITQERDCMQAARDQADNTLAALRCMAAVDNDDELDAAIRRAKEAATLEQEIARREQELREQGDGRSFEVLAAEADGVDLDSVAARISAIEAELRELEDTRLKLAETNLLLEHDLAAMERGRDASAAAEAAQDAIADMRRIAERYTRLRVASRLLRAGIERFRRQQEGPLLRRASAHFTMLTLGHYRRLRAESDDQDRAVLIACRPDGAECPVESLSEGTRDQLYLALRLAAIESHAERAEPLPFIADDLLVNFDDARAAAAITLLARFGRTTQTILFTHHEHIAALAAAAGEGVAVLRLMNAAEAAPRRVA